jgi:hypothetical protein
MLENGRQVTRQGGGRSLALMPRLNILGDVFNQIPSCANCLAMSALVGRRWSSRARSFGEQSRLQSVTFLARRSTWSKVWCRRGDPGVAEIKPGTGSTMSISTPWVEGGANWDAGEIVSRQECVLSALLSDSLPNQSGAAQRL